MKTAGIYRIELGNGWFYIGSATNFERRKKQHRKALNRKDHCNQKMQNVWNKYGVFKFIILEECRQDELLNREQFYLDQLFNNKKNVNILPTAGSWLGKVHSAKTKAKISAASKNRVLSAQAYANMCKPKSAEQRAKTSATLTGRVLSVKTCEKISVANKGKILSAETKAKISVAMSAAWDRRRSQGLLS